MWFLVYELQHLSYCPRNLSNLGVYNEDSVIVFSVVAQSRQIVATGERNTHSYLDNEINTE